MRSVPNGSSRHATTQAHPASKTDEFEAALLRLKSGKGEAQYKLRLYVTGSTSRSSQAIQNIRLICEKHLRNRYELEVIDIHQQPGQAQGEQIIAAPTLIKILPIPLRRMIGNLADMDRVLAGLDILPAC